MEIDITDYINHKEGDTYHKYGHILSNRENGNPKEVSLIRDHNGTEIPIPPSHQILIKRIRVFLKPTPRYLTNTNISEPGVHLNKYILKNGFPFELLRKKYLDGKYYIDIEQNN